MKYPLLTASILSMAIGMALPAISQAENHMMSVDGKMQMNDMQKCDYMKKRYYSAKVKEMHRALNLTDEQIKHYKDAHLKNRAVMKALREKMRAVKMQMNQLAMDKEMDPEKVNALREQYQALAVEKFNLKLNHKHEMYKVLTDEQKQKIKDRMSQRMMGRQ